MKGAGLAGPGLRYCTATDLALHPPLSRRQAKRADMARRDEGMEEALRGARFDASQLAAKLAEVRGDHAAAEAHVQELQQQVRDGREGGGALVGPCGGVQGVACTGD